MFDSHRTVRGRLLMNQHLIAKSVHSTRTCASSPLWLPVILVHQILSWYSWRIMEVSFENHYLLCFLRSIVHSEAVKQRLNEPSQSAPSLSPPPKGSITPISKPYRGNVSGQDIITHHWKRRPNQIKRIRRSKWATKLLHESFIHLRDCRTVLQECWIKDRMRLSKTIAQMLCNSRLYFKGGLISRVPTAKCNDHPQCISASAHLFGLCE